MEDVNSAEINMVQASPETVPNDDSHTGDLTELHGETHLVWQVILVKPRVDSFNQDGLIEEIKSAREKGTAKIALDLRSNKFLSFPVIKFCVATAMEVAEKDGAFVLLGCSERTKRHFEIYGSLDHIRVVRSERDLPELMAQTKSLKVSGNA